MSKPKIAIVFTIDLLRAAEPKVVLKFTNCTQMRQFTLLFVRWMARKVRQQSHIGYLQRWPVFENLMIITRFFDSGLLLDLSEFDIIYLQFKMVRQNSSAKSRPDQLHICCHTPTHFYWRHYEEYIKRPSFGQWLARLGLNLVRPLKTISMLLSVDVYRQPTGIQADIEEFYQRKVRLFFRQLTNWAFRHFIKIASETSIPKNLVWFGGELYWWNDFWYCY